MNDKKVKKFINDYETKIKKLRDRYYEKVNSKEFKDTTFTPNYNAISITITLIVCTLILIFFHGIIGDIIALIIATLSTIITSYLTYMFYIASFICILINKNKRSFHDFITNTKVIEIKEKQA